MPHPLQRHERVRVGPDGLIQLAESIDDEVLEAVRGLPDASRDRIGDALNGWLRQQLAREFKNLAQEFDAK